MHHPTDRITHTTAFVTPVVGHWLEWEIAQWVHPMKDRSDDPSHHERTLLPQSYISLSLYTRTLQGNIQRGKFPSILHRVITLLLVKSVAVPTGGRARKPQICDGSLDWSYMVDPPSQGRIAMVAICKSQKNNIHTRLFFGKCIC